MKIISPACCHIKAIWAVLSIAILTVLSCLTAGAASYYVSSSDPNASDSYTTPTAALPWKTIAKVNATTFTPGDTIYFKCGDTWRETLTVKSGSQTGATTTYTFYGTGAKPVISGASVITGWTVSSGGTANTYQAPLAAATYMVTSDNTFLKKGSSATTLAANQYYWTGGILSINIGADPTSHLVEAAQRNNAVYCASSGAAPKTYFYHNAVIGLRLEKTNSSSVSIQSSKYWTVKDCDLFFANSATGDGAGVNVNNSDDFTVTNSHIDYALGDGIIIYNSLRAIVTNNLVEHVFDGGVNSGGDCIQVDGNKGTHSADNFQILNNVVSRPDVTVEKGCIIAQCGENGIVSGNTCTGGKFGISVDGNYNTVSYNYVTGTGIYGGIRVSRDIDLSGIQIYYNVVTNNALPYSSGSAGVTITDDTRQHTGDPVGDHVANRSNCTISHNVFYNTYYGVIIERGSFSGKIENNISWNDAAFSTSYRINMTAGVIAGESLTIDHNIWQNKTGSSAFVRFGATTYANLAAWQVTGYDAHSSTSDPLWVNAPGNDFHLQVGSPAIDSGDNLGFTEDYEGNPVPQGLAPDMGAFEYQYAGSFAYEGFSYTSATVLSGLNGGSGWASGWTVSGSTGNAKTYGGGMTYTGLPSAGNGLRLTGTTTGIERANRTFSRTFGASQETYWISFLVKKLNSGLEDHIAFGGLDFRALSGNPWEVKTPATSYASTGASLTQQHLFLVRVDAGATSDTVRVWIDPVIASGEPAVSTAQVTLTDTPGFSFNTISLSQSLNGDTAKATQYDEFRLGGSFTSVVTGP